MISVQEKLSVFSQYLLEKQRKAGKETIDNAKAERDRLLAESAERIKCEVNSAEERSYRVIFRDQNKIVAQGKSTAKNSYLAERTEIYDDFMETILEESKAYLGTALYQDYLRKCIAKIPGILPETKEIIIYVGEADAAFVKKEAAAVLGDYTIEYRPTDETIIGGIIARDRDERVNADFTLRNLISENKKLIGMRFSKTMEAQVN